jgi:hypothetical protein
VFSYNLSTKEKNDFEKKIVKQLQNSVFLKKKGLKQGGFKLYYLSKCFIPEN